jgi:hypothetical protein
MLGARRRLRLDGDAMLGARRRLRLDGNAMPVASMVEHMYLVMEHSAFTPPLAHRTRRESGVDAGVVRRVEAQIGSRRPRSKS